MHYFLFILVNVQSRFKEFDDSPHIIMFVTIYRILEHIEEANFRGTTGRRYIETALVEVVL